MERHELKYLQYVSKEFLFTGICLISQFSHLLYGEARDEISTNKHLITEEFLFIEINQ